MTAAAADPRQRNRSAARRAVSDYRDYPVEFAQRLLGSWSRSGKWTPMRFNAKQRHILRAVAAMAARLEGRAPPKGSPEVGDKRKLSVRSGQKTGKSLLIAIIVIWWTCTRFEARTIMSSSSGRQVKTVLWKEFKRVHRGARFPLGGVVNKDPETGWQLPDGREVIGFATDEPEKAAGLSGRALLLVLDEASGIADAIIKAFEGNTAGGALLLMFSNPTKTSGEFFDSHHSPGSQWYFTVHISSREAQPAAEAKIPGLATVEYCDAKLKEWGEDSPAYQVRVLGNFPTQAENCVISLELLHEATQRWTATYVDERGRFLPTKVPKKRLHLGLDAARFGGDENVLVARRGQFVYPPRTFRPVRGKGDPAQQVADWTLSVARELRRPGEELPLLKVDVAGEGAAAFSILRQSPELEVLGIHVQEPATAEGYRAMRDQLWFATKEWMMGGGALPGDERLGGELVAVTFKFDAQNRQMVESKDELRKRLSRSPDRADALNLAVLEAGALASEVINDETKMPRARFASSRQGNPDPFEDDDEEDDDDD